LEGVEQNVEPGIGVVLNLDPGVPGLLNNVGWEFPGVLNIVP
jgi:hypothetical protein